MNKSLHIMYSPIQTLMTNFWVIVKSYTFTLACIVVLKADLHNTMWCANIWSKMHTSWVTWHNTNGFSTGTSVLWYWNNLQGQNESKALTANFVSILWTTNVTRKCTIFKWCPKESKFKFGQPTTMLMTSQGSITLYSDLELPSIYVYPITLDIHLCLVIHVVLQYILSFSALTLLVGWQEGHPGP